MRVVVDYELCEGNARCVRACPEVFELSDDDKAKILIARPADALRSKLEAAVRICPRQAISIAAE